MTDRHARWLRWVSTTITASVFIYLAIASYGAGDTIGPFIAFYGLLVWAMAEQAFRQALDLAKEAIAGWRNLLETIK